eukprot:gene10673-12624_t
MAVSSRASMMPVDLPLVTLFSAEQAQVDKIRCAEDRSDFYDAESELIVAMRMRSRMPAATVEFEESTDTTLELGACHFEAFVAAAGEMD